MTQKKETWALVRDDLTDGIEFATMLELAFSVDSRVVSTTIEEGSFAAYNKVDNPDAIAVRAMLAGDKSTQEAALDALKKAKGSTDLYRVITPFETFAAMTVVSLKWVRTVDGGAVVTIVDITLQEVRQAKVLVERMSTPKQVKNASCVSNTKTGRVAPKTVPAAQTEKVAKQFRAKGLDSSTFNDF